MSLIVGQGPLTAADIDLLNAVRVNDLGLPPLHEPPYDTIMVELKKHFSKNQTVNASQTMFLSTPASFAHIDDGGAFGYPAVNCYPTLPNGLYDAQVPRTQSYPETFDYYTGYSPARTYDVDPYGNVQPSWNMGSVSDQIAAQVDNLTTVLGDPNVDPHGGHNPTPGVPSTIDLSYEGIAAMMADARARLQAHQRIQKQAVKDMANVGAGPKLKVVKKSKRGKAQRKLRVKTG